MQLASVGAKGRGVTDRLLTNIVERLRADGLWMAGAIRATRPSAGSGYCDSALLLLPDGPVIDITQDLGTGSEACRMDAGALEMAVSEATKRLATENVNLVVLNKFGLSEAEGRGFRTLIAEALERDLPVLIGVSDVHKAAFESFTGGMAVQLPPDEDAVFAWCQQAAHKARAPYEDRAL